MFTKQWRKSVWGTGFAAVAATLVVACGGSRPERPPGGAPAPTSDGTPPVPSTGPKYDQVRLYQQLGLLARGAPMPFVGNASFLASATKDSTHVLLGVGLSNAALTFSREGDRFRASYTIEIALKQNGSTVKQTEARESVVLTSYRETSRIDESIIFQELLTLRPGLYNLVLTVRDDGSSRSSTEDVTLQIPEVQDGMLSSPITFARASTRISRDSLPQIISSPTSTVTFGTDSTVPIYLEGYNSAGGARLPVRYAVMSESGKAIFSDSTSIPRRGNLYSGIVLIPVSRLAIGASQVAFVQPGRTDSVKAPVFVGFGEDLPVASYEDMVNYLRWFAPGYQINALRDTAPEFRAGAWAAFVKAHSGLNGSNEPLRDYFRRLLAANARFREEGIPGWLTDRGKVLLGLGEPDQVYEQRNNDFSQQRGRSQIWDYRGMNIQLTFYDQTGFGRWKLVNSSEIAFQAAWRRKTQ
jgi:GWxTD domain-containing protein